MALWLLRAAAAVHESRDWLTALDAAIGDGDHGINLDRGLAAVAQRIDLGGMLRDAPGGAGVGRAGAADPAAAGPGVSDAGAAGAGALLTMAGTTILGSVGGAGGALYGRAFLAAGRRIGELTGATPPADDRAIAVEAFDAAVAAISVLGRSAAGEKTMLDALVPAAGALRSGSARGAPIADCLEAAADAARRGALDTIPMVARKGRASYLGERSVGHQDPGAASSVILVSALADVAANRRGG